MTSEHTLLIFMLWLLPPLSWVVFNDLLNRSTSLAGKILEDHKSLSQHFGTDFREVDVALLEISSTSYYRMHKLYTYLFWPLDLVRFLLSLPFWLLGKLHLYCAHLVLNDCLELLKRPSLEQRDVGNE